MRKANEQAKVRTSDHQEREIKRKRIAGRSGLANSSNWPEAMRHSVVATWRILCVRRQGARGDEIKVFNDRGVEEAGVADGESKKWERSTREMQTSITWRLASILRCSARGR